MFDDELPIDEHDFFSREVPPPESDEELAREFYSRADITGAAESDQPAEVDTSHVVFRPYEFPDEDSLPPRDWIIHGLLVRGYVTMTVAPGGVGKSSLTIAECLELASRPRIDPTSKAETLSRVWLCNLEDPNEEMDLRLAAVRRQKGIPTEDLRGQLAVLTMRSINDKSASTSLRVVHLNRSGAQIVRPIVDTIVSQILENKVDVLVVDPFISTHSVPENDNTAINLVIEAWREVATRGRCAVHLVHHTRKLNGERASADSARGGSAIGDGARFVRTLNVMSDSEAKELGIDRTRRRFYFYTLHEKQSMAPPLEKREWYELKSITLANGEDLQAVEKWTPPDQLEGVTTDHLDRLVAAVAKGNFKASSQADDWGGYKLAEILELDVGKGLKKYQLKDEQFRNRSKVESNLKTWLTTGQIAKEKRPDTIRKDRREVWFLVEGPQYQINKRDD